MEISIHSIDLHSLNVKINIYWNSKCLAIRNISHFIWWIFMWGLKPLFIQQEEQQQQHTNKMNYSTDIQSFEGFCEKVYSISNWYNSILCVIIYMSWNGDGPINSLNVHVNRRKYEMFYLQIVNAWHLAISTIHWPH